MSAPAAGPFEQKIDRAAADRRADPIIVMRPPGHPEGDATDLLQHPEMAGETPFLGKRHRAVEVAVQRRQRQAEIFRPIIDMPRHPPAADPGPILLLPPCPDTVVIF